MPSEFLRGGVNIEIPSVVYKGRGAFRSRREASKARLSGFFDFFNANYVGEKVRLKAV